MGMLYIPTERTLARTECKSREGPTEKTGVAMAPHITHFRIKAKPGERQHVIDLFDRWFRDRRSKAHGFARADLSSNVNDPDEFMASACFADRATYDANSND